MKNFKRSIGKLLLTSFSIMTIIGSSTVIAEKESASVKKEKDFVELNIEDIISNDENDGNESDHQKAILRNNSSGESYNVKLYERKKIGNETRNTNKEEKEEGQYVKEFAVVLDDENITQRTQSKAGGYQSSVKWDGSLSVKGWIQVFYNYKTIDGKEHYLLTQVKGNWRVEDYAIRLSNPKVRYTCTNWGINQNVARAVPIPFDIMTGFTKYANASLSPTTVGAHTFVEIQRNSQSWNLMVPSIIVQNDV